ncbi:MAG: ribosome silencing factor, partial [Bdellovibrionota bacterium]
LRGNERVVEYIPLSVERYIKDSKFYQPVSNKITDYKEFTKFCGDQISQGKGIQVKAFDLTEMSSPSEYTLIASGTSTRHTEALAENLVRAVKTQYSLYPQSVEGTGEGRWVVIDYGLLIVHIFYDYVRNEYELENLWKQGSEIPLTQSAPAR